MKKEGYVDKKFLQGLQFTENSEILVHDSNYWFIVCPQITRDKNIISEVFACLEWISPCRKWRYFSPLDRKKQGPELISTLSGNYDWKYQRVDKLCFDHFFARHIFC